MPTPAPSWPARFGGAALVTGASSGLGAAFARALGARGMDVLLVARREDRLRELAVALEAEHGVRAAVAAVDLLHPDAPDRLVAAAKAAELDVGLLVNNAGFGQYGPFEALDASDAERMVELNCRVPVALTYAFLPPMLERGRGGLLFVASIAGYQPAPYYATYSASKAFDLIFAEALYGELQPKGIEVLALSPGYTPTEFQQVAGSHRAPTRGSHTTAEEVVEAGLAALGRQPSLVPGAKNKVMTWATRFVSRRAVTRLARFYSDPSRGSGE